MNGAYKKDEGFSPDAGFIWKGREDLKKCTLASPFVTLGPLSWECVRSFVVICWRRDSNSRKRIFSSQCFIQILDYFRLRKYSASRVKLMKLSRHPVAPFALLLQENTYTWCPHASPPQKLFPDDGQVYWEKKMLFMRRQVAREMSPNWWCAFIDVWNWVISEIAVLFFFWSEAAFCFISLERV